jgi:hypothetical protein
MDPPGRAGSTLENIDEKEVKKKRRTKYEAL